MGTLRPDLEQYTRRPGDPGLPGAGRPVGSKTKLPALPPIHVDSMPFQVKALKRGETAAEYWERQSPKVLTYLFKRFNMHIAYQENGINDPFGAQVFKLLGKELVKDVRTKAKKNASDNMNIPNEGRDVKKFRQQLVQMEQSLVTDADVIEVDDVQDGEYSAAKELDGLGISGLEDEF